MPRIRFDPRHGLVIIRKRLQEQKSAGGIILPESAKDLPMVHRMWEVFRVADDVPDAPPVGSLVTLRPKQKREPEHHGAYKSEGWEYVLVHHERIVCVAVEDPEGEYLDDSAPANDNDDAEDDAAGGVLH